MTYAKTTYTGIELRKELENLVREACWDYGVEYYDEILETVLCDVSYFDLSDDNIEERRFDSIIDEAKERIDIWKHNVVPFVLAAVS